MATPHDDDVSAQQGRLLKCISHIGFSQAGEAVRSPWKHVDVLKTGWRKQLQETIKTQHDRNITVDIN